MTRQRYLKLLVNGAIGMLLGILISTYLFGEPWSASQVMAMFAGLAIFTLVTWGLGRAIQMMSKSRRH